MKKIKQYISLMLVAALFGFTMIFSGCGGNKGKSNE